MAKTPIPHAECRASRGLLKETSGRSTEPKITDVDVNEAAEILVTISVSVPRQEAGANAVRGFTAAQIRELRRLASSASSPEVQRAAMAVLDFASGKSYRDCAQGTPYGEGWVRALVQAFRSGGADALKDRKYRKPWESQGQREA